MSADRRWREAVFASRPRIHRILTDAKVTMRNRGYRKPSGLGVHRDDE
ncbi:hypothetical protein [Streptomyces noursei]